MNQDNDNKSILAAHAEIPHHEKWLFENRTALQQVKKGLEDAAKNRFIDRDDFAKNENNES